MLRVVEGDHLGLVFLDFGVLKFPYPSNPLNPGSLRRSVTLKW